MSEREFITDKIYEQIIAIKNDGAFNMFDVLGVQRDAHNRNFHELVIFLEEHRKEYAQFIQTGQR